MLREIGGDFWDYPTLIDRKRFTIGGVAAPMYAKYYISGRGAIRAFARLNKWREKRILLPEFTCGTVVIPFEKEGWELFYYRINRNLEIDALSICEKIDEVSPGVVYLQSYFGFHTLEKIQDIVEYCHEKKIVVIEDITQNLFSKFKKTNADYFVASLRKYFAMPEGGLLISMKDNLSTSGYSPRKEIVEQADRAFQLKKMYMRNDLTISKEEFMRCLSLWKDNFVKYDDAYDMNEATIERLSQIDTDFLFHARRRNYKYLLKCLVHIEWLEPIFGVLKVDELPLYFPVYIKNPAYRETIQRSLAQKNIFCPVIWPQYKHIHGISKDGEYIYKHILCIPCDQRYGLEEMKYICTIFSDISLQDYKGERT